MLCALAGVALQVVGCSGDSERNGDGSTNGGTTSGGATTVVGGTTNGGATNGGATNGGTTSQCTPPVTQKRHPGVYDYESCNDCHTDLLGGWVYSNAVGDAWVPGATVTLTNIDNTTISATTAVDGFFHLVGATMTTTTSFLPCVERCGDKTCATQQHTSLNCQTAECHGGNNRLIYLNQAGVGGAPSTGTDCSPPASGGPRMHYPEFDDQTCVTCHEPGYLGGYVYDGVDSLNPVSMATVTITPEGGTPIVAVTGPGGMFQVPGTLTAPYSVCVSKCPDKVCSLSTSHPNTKDCASCHNSTAKLRIHLP